MKQSVEMKEIHGKEKKEEYRGIKWRSGKYEIGKSIKGM